jgi:hypothetical protein
MDQSGKLNFLSDVEVRLRILYHESLKYSNEWRSYRLKENFEELIRELLKSYLDYPNNAEFVEKHKETDKEAAKFKGKLKSFHRL